MIQDEKIIIKKENGEEKEFSILVKFELKEKNKNYVIYTDYSKTEQGNIKVYASIYGKNGDLEIITEKDEIGVIQDYIENLEKDLKSGIKLY